MLNSIYAPCRGCIVLGQPSLCRKCCLALLCESFGIKHAQTTLSADVKLTVLVAHTLKPSSRGLYHHQKMPKISLSLLPLSGLFGVIKPSGPTSMHIINEIKPLIAGSRIFVDAATLEKNKKSKGKGARGRRGKDGIKIGQGGTLDPLADGVLGAHQKNSFDLNRQPRLVIVIGVGKGTKKLNEFLDCSKVRVMAFIIF